MTDERVLQKLCGTEISNTEAVIKAQIRCIMCDWRCTASISSARRLDLLPSMLRGQVHPDNPETEFIQSRLDVSFK